MAAILSPMPTALPDLWGQIGSVLRNALKEDLKTLTGNTAMATSILDLVDARFGELATSEPARRLVGGRFVRHLSSSSSVLDVSLATTTASLRRHFGRATLEEQQGEDTNHDTSVVLDSTTASVRRHLNSVALDDEQEEEDIEEHHSAALDTSVFPAAPPSPAARPDNVIVEDSMVEMREPSVVPPSPVRPDDVVDEDMEQSRYVSAAGRLSPVHPDDVIVEKEDTTMHEPSAALDATMLSLAGRLSPLHSADDMDESMRQASVTPLAAREDKDEPMPLARQYIKAHRRLASIAQKRKEAEPMDVEEQQTPPSPRAAELVVVPVAGAAHAAQPVPTDDDEEPKEAEDLEDREGETEDPTGEAEDAAEEAVDPEGEAVDAAEEAVDPKGEVVDPEDPEVEPQKLEMGDEVQPHSVAFWALIKMECQKAVLLSR
ncbi:hypothetical protein PRIPAC_76099 [Pristionchus pacificus]|uniref:Uncharacterized protein n=1 Tax=Pristionchus pacificus TaxID=54126 RepID=A0A454Y4J4_PRIPA|nr:hypothetical protein PRIPAC_76099 [Pristionchus pacificus]|eukprot:PDM76752.1 hypothetical protein PRIPAC_42147 [Pristionchus pacificus]